MVRESCVVALDMFANKRQARREQGNDTLSTDDNIAIFPLATGLLSGPALALPR